MSIFTRNLPNNPKVIVVSDVGQLVKYLLESEYEVYYVNGISLFEDLIEKLLGYDPVIVIEFDSYTSILRLLRFLYTFDDDLKKLKVRKDFMEKCDTYNNDKPTTGTCDYPLNTRIIINIREFNPVELTSLESLKQQQILRFIALLHGGSFIVSRSPIGQLLKENELLNPIYQDFLSIPQGWDSWDRIKILSKSTYDSEGLFVDDDDLKGFYQVYTEFLRGEDTIFKYLKIDTPKVVDSYVPKTYEDLIQSFTQESSQFSTQTG